MQFVSLKAKLIDVFLRHLAPCFILVRIQDRLDLESRAGPRATDEIHHGFKVDQRLALPVQAIEGEQPLLLSAFCRATKSIGSSVECTSAALRPEK